MMDPSTEETLSRYIDGDLEAREAAALEARLAEDHELAAELAALRDLREAVASLADQMEPPAELDAMMAPLRRGVPPRTMRPAVRWLGMAAALALGFIVVVEVSRRSPGPAEESLAPMRDAASTPVPTEIYQLAPLPKSEVAPEDQPLGAVDRLLASPLPDPDPGEPEPMQVIGPLSTADASSDEERESFATGKKGPAAAEAGRGAGLTAGALQEARSEMPAPSVTESKRDAPRERSRVQAAGRIELSTADGEPVAELPLSSPLPPFAGLFEVVVSEGVITEAYPIGASDDATSAPTEAVIGMAAPGVQDGRYAARVTRRAAATPEGSE